MADDRIEPQEAERNKELLRRLIDEGFSRGEVGVVDEIISAEHREHQKGIRPGPQGAKGTIAYLRSVFPDLALTIEERCGCASPPAGPIRVRSRGAHPGGGASRST